MVKNIILLGGLAFFLLFVLLSEILGSDWGYLIFDWSVEDCRGGKYRRWFCFWFAGHSPWHLALLGWLVWELLTGFLSLSLPLSSSNRGGVYYYFFFNQLTCTRLRGHASLFHDMFYQKVLMLPYGVDLFIWLILVGKDYSVDEL